MNELLVNASELVALDSRGRFKVDKSGFIQKTNIPDFLLFTEHREMSAFGETVSTDFTVIDKAVYLTQKQICELFKITEKSFRDHLDAIYGFNLQNIKGGGIFPPPFH